MKFNIHNHIDSLPLHGTDKQIQWAMRIRRQRLGTLLQNKQKIYHLIGKHITPEEVIKLEISNAKRLNQMYSSLVVACLDNPNARDWINERDRDIMDYVVTNWRRVKAFYLTNKPEYQE